METTNKILLNVKEVMEATGLCRTTIYKHIKGGDLQYVKIGGRTLFRPVDLQQFVNNALQLSA